MCSFDSCKTSTGIKGVPDTASSSWLGVARYSLALSPAIELEMSGPSKAAIAAA
jgi:hypothetical protein